MKSDQQLENCYRLRGKSLDFNDLKYFDFNDFIHLAFEYIELDFRVEHFTRPENSYTRNYPDIYEILPQCPDDEQDMYWLYLLLKKDGLINFFLSDKADFAPYIYRALLRQNIPDAADTFQKIMNIFGMRYDGFNRDEVSIHRFDLRDCDNILLTEGQNIQYFLKAEIKKTIAPTSMQAFPRTQQLYQIMRDRIYEKPQLKSWFERLVLTTTDHERVLVLVQKLYDSDTGLDLWLTWPEPYKYLYLLEALKSDFITILCEYFIDNDYNDSNDDLSFYNTLNDLQFNDIATLISDAFQCYQRVRPSISDFLLRKNEDPNHLCWEISVAPDFIEFAPQLDEENFPLRLEFAMLSIARKFDLIPR